MCNFPTIVENGYSVADSVLDFGSAKGQNEINDLLAAFIAKGLADFLANQTITAAKLLNEEYRKTIHSTSANDQECTKRLVDIIIEQSEEIGRLKFKIETLEHRKDV